MTKLAIFVYGAGVYNLLLAVGMAMPAITRTLGANIADPALGQLIAGFLVFTAVIQMIGSRDLRTNGWAVFWEGILRWVAAALLIPYGFFGHLGLTAGVLGMGDFLIGLVYLIVLPRVVGKRTIDLLLGK